MIKVHRVNKSIRWMSSFQENELLSIKWTSSQVDGFMIKVHRVDKSIRWTSSFQENELVHKVDKFTSGRIYD